MMKRYKTLVRPEPMCTYLPPWGLTRLDFDFIPHPRPHPRFHSLFNGPFHSGQDSIFFDQPHMPEEQGNDSGRHEGDPVDPQLVRHLPTIIAVGEKGGTKKSL